MQQIQAYKLIDGEFDPSEAWNILFTLLNSKINFHSMESFGIAVRTSGDTSFHERRIKELAQTKKDIKKCVDFATENKLRFRINATINVELTDQAG